jgi:hypothetical protein
MTRRRMIVLVRNYPNRPVKDGKWHSVRIRMKSPDYSARARKEYLDKP